MENAIDHHYVTYPKCGMSKVPLKIVEPNEERLEWISFPMDFLLQRWADSIMEVVNRNNLVIDDIDYFIFSQLSDVYNAKTLKILGVPFEKRNIILWVKNMDIPVTHVLSCVWTECGMFIFKRVLK